MTRSNQTLPSLISNKALLSSRCVLCFFRNMSRKCFSACANDRLECKSCEQCNQGVSGELWGGLYDVPWGSKHHVCGWRLVGYHVQAQNFPQSGECLLLFVSSDFALMCFCLCTEHVCVCVCVRACARARARKRMCVCVYWRRSLISAYLYSVFSPLQKHILYRPLRRNNVISGCESESCDFQSHQDCLGVFGETKFIK